MELCKVTVNNFCSCDDVQVSLSRFNPIIGCNNAGKSNILRAINWLLRKSVLPSSCFRDETLPVTVEGEIRNVDLQLLPPNQRGPVERYVVDGILRFRRRQDTPNSPAAQIKIDVLDPASENWAVNPAGLDNAISVLFPDPLYIEAMDDSAEDVSKVGARTTIGLLLKYTLEQIRTNNNIALQNLQNALNQVGQHLNGANRIQQLSNLEVNATNEIDAFFPGLSFHLEIKDPTLDDLVKGATISLSEQQGHQRPFASFGHGAQRSVQMAMIKLLAAQLGQGQNNGSIIVLLIDEPELYLHPQAIELLRAALVTLASQNFQIIFSTHSPLLVGREHVLNTLVVKKDGNGRTTVRRKLASAATTLAANPHQANVIFSLQNSTYLLFSEAVLLVEGKTEKMLLPDIYKTILGRTLAHDKMCIVEASSSSSIISMMTVLRNVGYAPKAVVDLDFVFKIAPGNNLIPQNDQDLLDCKNWFAANIAAHSYVLGNDGLPSRKDAAGNQAGMAPEVAFELMALAMNQHVTRLVQKLAHHNIWVWAKGAIESHLGIDKNDTSRIQFLATLNNNGNLNHATDAQGVATFINWAKP